MLKLLKFEVLKKRKAVIMSILAYLVVNFALVMKFKTDGPVSLDGELAFPLVILIVVASGFLLLAFIGAINNLRVETKNSSRDLYFSLPMSSYTKIAVKTIVSTIEILGAFLIAVIVYFQSFKILTGMNLLKTFLDGIDTAQMSNLFSSSIISVLYVIISVLLVYLAFAIFRSFFSQIKFGELFTILIYVLINYLMIRYVFVHIGFSQIIKNAQESIEPNVLMSLLSILGVTGVLFIIVGYLFENKVSFD